MTPVVLDSIRTLLKAYGNHVISVVDGDAALQAIRIDGAAPDLLIVDFHLARGVTGIDVAERIAGLLRYPLPIILLTADPQSIHIP
jgi:CheY-like chemotaxis protein